MPSTIPLHWDDQKYWFFIAKNCNSNNCYQNDFTKDWDIEIKKDSAKLWLCIKSLFHFERDYLERLFKSNIKWKTNDIGNFLIKICLNVYANDALE